MPKTNAIAFPTLEEAEKHPKGKNQSVYSVTRGGETKYAVAKTPIAARAAVSALFGDTCEIVGGKRKQDAHEKMASKLKALPESERLAIIKLLQGE